MHALAPELESILARQGRCRLPPLSFSATAFLALELSARLARPVVLVADSLHSLDELRRNLLALAQERPGAVLYYPAWEMIPGPRAPAAPETAGARLDTLLRLPGFAAPGVIATCVQALMQPALAPAALRDWTLRLRPQMERDPDALAGRLEQAGYRLEPDVQAPGQAARRGGLLDLWPPTLERPVRIEFFGDQIESLRSFDPATQRSVAPLDDLLVPPADEARLMREQPGARGYFLDHGPPDPLLFWAEPVIGDGLADIRQPTGILHHARLYEQAAAGSGWIFSFAQAAQRAEECPRAWHCYPDRDPEPPADPAAAWPPEAPRLDPGFRSMTALAAPARGLLAPDVFAEQRRQWIESLAVRARAGLRVQLYFHTPGALDRFREQHPESSFDLRTGLLSDGFMHAGLNRAVLSESNLLGRRKRLPDRDSTAARTAGAGRAAGERLTDWTRLEPGDLVVHLEHGIGRFLGLGEMTFHGQPQEALTLEYADRARLYVPVSQVHLLSRYVGVGKHAPALHRLGGARWGREKAAAERAVQDLAATLLEVQARRESMAGFAFPADTPWQHEFEASFPYQETADQERAIRDVKRDMESRRPMDRLVCGDVGYGKTEVALRAAFKCVLSGKQAAVLVPTTVLAQQHYEVFAERLAAYPVRVEWMCRFRSRSEQDAVARGLASGAVDIVIGTHRLLQPDVAFKDLGLVIIDEEQRFGVGHKECFKQRQQLVDVLTLTATPIPRTLYLSLTGAKEISIIQTSPLARQPIETRVVKNEDRLIREAVLQELNRGGQAFYLHNRVHSIERVRQRLAALLPEARIAVGHGRMPTAELAHVVRDFARGAFDLLLCTTIIESGLDIPNVNTILIDRADRFGMADLYQLRGRVGRSSRQAYAYLLLPTHGHVLDGSRRRLAAIVEHAELGAGFRLALRDLEIRGAGNLLGAEQSGHITAVGFDLYCQLLRRTIARLGPKGSAPPEPEAPVVAVDVRLDFIDLSAASADTARAVLLPTDFVEDERLRIGVYRQIASAASLAEIDALRGEFRDRFGPLPPPLQRLLQVAALRVRAAEKRLAVVEVTGGQIRLYRNGEPLQLRSRFPRLRSTGTDAQLAELRDWIERVTESGFRG